MTTAAAENARFGQEEINGVTYSFQWRDGALISIHPQPDSEVIVEILKRESARQEMAKAAAKPATPPKMPLEHQVIAWFFIAALMFGALVAFWPGDGRSSASSQSQALPDMSVWYVSHQFVLRYLKSPSSAKFPNPYRDPGNFCIKMSDGNWSTSGYVDSQNSFGAMLRTYWTATLKPDGKDSFRLQYLQIDGKVVMESRR